VLVSSLLAASFGVALLFIGGESLVRGAARLALRLGISPLAVGLTVVAFGTSAPELVVSLDAALSGANDIALGNVVGSNICNVGLILGLSGLLASVGVEAKIVRLDAPLVVAASLLLIGLLADGSLSRIEGGLLLAGLFVYVLFTFWESRRESEPVREEISSAGQDPSRGWLRDGGLVIVGLAALVAGGHLLVGAAVEFATALGVSQAVVGLTIVAVGTSLPELATSLVASARGYGDIAVGNVVGSNLFNILGILGTTALVSPVTRGDIGWTDLSVMLGFSVLLVPLLLTRRRLDRFESGALLASYVAYVAWRATA
jgi:cation:H+ antiporter